MEDHEVQGYQLRANAKAIVFGFMRKSESCKPDQSGLTQSQIFRECGFDWGDKKAAPSGQQQFWVVALLRELEAEGKVVQVSEHGPWRLQ